MPPWLLFPDGPHRLYESLARRLALVLLPILLTLLFVCKVALLIARIRTGGERKGAHDMTTPRDGKRRQRTRPVRWSSVGTSGHTSLAFGGDGGKQVVNRCVIVGENDSAAPLNCHVDLTRRQKVALDRESERIRYVLRGS